jgi:serine/threonine-protein kinase
VTYGGDGWAAAGVREGEILADKYRVERVLGIGGMGAVVAAHHLQLDTKVAIKFLLPHMLAHQDAVARFAREARNAVRITNEHVARVWDVGTLDNGVPYMVMEYLQGADLSALLRQRGPLPIEDAIDFILQAMEALAEAHVLGIVHRDLKPANLFCIRRPDRKQSIKVLDFGISKATAPGGASGNLVTTATASLMGSPFYMSPEQIETANAVDSRTDIWALGVILFELLAGTVPFYGETIPEVALKIAARAPSPLRDYRPDVPEGLHTAIFACLEKNRDRRFQNVAELALALLPFASGRAKASVERITDTLRAAGLPVTTLSPPGSPALGARGVVALEPNPSSEPPRIETISPLGRTTAGNSGGRAMATFLALGGIVAAAGGVAAFRLIAAHKNATDSGPLAMASVVAQASAATPAEAGAGIECKPPSKRCSGAEPQTCVGGQWVPGAVTAGQCDAVCTPSMSRPRCNARTPQTCDPTGHWIDGVACAKPRACREGACIDPAPPPQPPKNDCDPPYYWDHGNRVFKMECL